MSQSSQPDALSAKRQRLLDSIALAEYLLAKRRDGVSKRLALRQLHHWDARHSVGEERAESNPHVDGQRKREMRIRLENHHGQRMLRRRARDIYEGEQDTERILAANDAAYDFDFDAQLASTDSGDDQLSVSPREEQNNA